MPDLIGSELNSLYYLFGSIDPDSIKFIFNITNDSVWIEVISIEGQYNTLLSLLQTETYGSQISSATAPIHLSSQANIRLRICLNWIVCLS